MNTKNALVVIDIQNFFVNEYTHSLPKKISELIENSDFDYILFSKFVNSPDSNFYKILKWHECEESPDIDIHPAMLKYTNESNVFEKTSFSVFKSKMADFFVDNNISKISFCGADIDACVLSSAYEAFDLGYDVEILKDYSLSNFGPKLDSSAIKIIEKNLEQLKV